MTLNIDLSKNKKLILILMCFIIAFTFCLTPPVHAEAITLTAGFLYFLYTCGVAGATFYQLSDAQSAYNNFKQSGSSWDNFKSNMETIGSSVVNQINSSSGSTREEKIANIGSSLTQNVFDWSVGVYQQLKTWFNSSSSIGVFNSSMSLSYDGKQYHSVLKKTTLNGGETVPLMCQYVNGVEVQRYAFPSAYSKNNWFVRFDKIVIDGGYAYFEYVTNGVKYYTPKILLSLNPSDTDVSNDFKKTSFAPSNAFDNPSTSVSVPFFPDSFVPGYQGDLVDAPVSVPSGALENPDGSLAHPQDWSGDWVFGFPTDGMTVPQGWTGDIPGITVPGDVTIPGDVTVPGDTTGTIGEGVLNIPILGDILKILLEILKAILGIPTAFMDLLKDLFIPDVNFWRNNFDSMEVIFLKKVGDGGITELNKMKSISESPWQDIEINVMGYRGVIKVSVVNTIASTIRPWITGFFLLLLALYNYNQLYFAIRGTYPISIGNTTRGGEK